MSVAADMQGGRKVQHRMYAGPGSNRNMHVSWYLMLVHPPFRHQLATWVLLFGHDPVTNKLPCCVAGAAAAPSSLLPQAAGCPNSPTQQAAGADPASSWL
jgi:hypothetical protein